MRQRLHGQSAESLVLQASKNTIKTDSHLGLFKFDIPKANLQGTSQHVRTASGATRMIISNVMIGASAWLMRPVANIRAGHVM